MTTTIKTSRLRSPNKKTSAPVRASAQISGQGESRRTASALYLVRSVTRLGVRNIVNRCADGGSSQPYLMGRTRVRIPPHRLPRRGLDWLPLIECVATEHESSGIGGAVSPMPILLDHESRSRIDLTVVGGREYWEHPSTEPLCCVLWDTDAGELEVWEPGMPRPKLIDRGQLGAHNARGFDRFANKRLGWPDIEIDTSELARAAGLPGALDALATRWLGLEKDKVASKFTKGLSSARRPTAKTAHRAPEGLAIDAAVWAGLGADEKRLRGVQPVYGPAERARVIPYCISDVEVLAHGWDTLETWQGIEPDVSRVERAVNDRGVCFDSQLARRLLEEDARNGQIVIERVAIGATLSPARVRAIAGSPEQFAEYTGLPNAQAETIAEALRSGELSADAEAMCEARGALASIARGKLEAGLARVSADGRLRDSHRYIGGHTWRWSGSGMQLQNMPRPSKRFEEWKDAEIRKRVDHVLRGGHVDQDEIDLLLRACIHARPGHTLVVEDFSGVEARGLAWAAGDRKAIEVFRSGLDVYKVIAAVIFGCRYEDIGKDERRQVGKVTELACGYGMGWKKFYANNRKELDAAHVDPVDVVEAYRKLHAPVVQFWYACERAMRDAIQGQRKRVGPFEFVCSSEGKDVAVIMPTGRPLVYNEARIGRGENGKPRLSYKGRMWREDLYGGKIVENLIQSCCRELLAGAMVEADDAGLDPVLHVHDELVCEVPRSAEAEGREYLHTIMTTVPDWAEGFPLGADGHSGTRYRK